MALAMALCPNLDREGLLVNAAATVQPPIPKVKISIMAEYGAMLLCFSICAYVVANAIYTLISPEKFLTNRWTRGWRGLKPGTPNSEVRQAAVLMLLCGAGFGFGAFMFARIIWNR